MSTDRVLPMFGYDLFGDVPSTFAPVENVPVTPDYTIGPGDELLIRAWGQIDIDYRAIVDRNGNINIPKIGTINVSGIKYQDLTAYVKTAVSRNFRNFDLLVTLGQLRSIQIFVVGQARRPGSYTVSSLSTLVNAIFSVGGPSGRGSMRGVQLKRGNQIVREFDMYDLLVKGDKANDAPLLPGDVIYFPPIGPLAALSGSVNNAAIFELKGETPLATLIEWAGGLSTTAQTRKVSIERIQDRRTRVVDQFELDAEQLKRSVRDGDLVSIFSISPKFENAVTLRGNVASPLRYPYREGMRIRDLIPDKEALITPDYYLRRNLAVRLLPTQEQRRTDRDRLERNATDRDRLERTDRDRLERTDRDRLERNGTDRDRLERDRPERERLQADVGQEQLRNVLVRATTEINWDYAVVERLNPDDLSSTLLPFNLGKALEGDSQHDLPLRAGDVVTIFSKLDIRVPEERQTKYIRLEGEFAAPGVYQAMPGETLRQLVLRAGGLSRHAYLFGSDFLRESTRVQQQKRLKEAVDRLEADIQRATVSRTASVLNPEDAAALKVEAENQRALLTRLRNVAPTGRIVLELPDEAELRDLPDLALEDGDRFSVPSKPSMVNVIGSVYAENAFVYRQEKRVADYLAQAGGPTRDADKSSIYMIRADGSVLSRRQSGILFTSLDSAKVMPGDTIVVPEEFDKTSWTRVAKDWTQIIYQLGLGAAAIHVLQK